MSRSNDYPRPEEVTDIITAISLRPSTPLNAHIEHVKVKRIQRRKRSETYINHDLHGGFEADPSVSRKKMMRYQVYSVTLHRIIFSHDNCDDAIEYAKACHEQCRVIDSSNDNTVFRNWI